jgi:tRNA wybutosine-synthesizing protein 4
LKVTILKNDGKTFSRLHEQQPRFSSNECFAKDYCILSGDLRKWTAFSERLVKDCGLDLSLPTIVLSECVLIYLQKQYSDAIVNWAGSLQESFFVTYEQINPDDPFGQVMIRNLKTRNIDLHGIHSYPSLDRQIDRYKKSGFAGVEAKDLNTIIQEYDQEEIERINKIERLDEIEEFTMLMEHYMLLCASNSSKFKLDFKQ